MDLPEQEKPAKTKTAQSRGSKRNALNKKTVQRMLLQVSKILKQDEKEHTLTHRERLGYLNSAIRLARVLGERDKATLKASKTSPFS